MSEYRIERTQPIVYIDRAGKPVRGYLVSVYLSDYDEYHELYLPDLNPKTVKQAADELLENRKALSEL